ncbi:MAG: substrate-binding domain-containing protein [Mycobacteriaceae bacterium]|uniref:substrate-binding domain-containing protein n=1 Tax=Corynebacterium sp. TaxID=1720 RepID=UPI003F9777CB
MASRGGGRRTFTALTVAATAGFGVAACGDDDSNQDSPVLASGSATVNPITAAVARDTGASVDQTTNGTLEGFERFCAGETHINNASEAIPGDGQATDFMAMCEENGVDYVELPVALDTITLVRHADNSAVDDLTAGELRAIWEPGSEITTWSDVRGEWPDEEISLVGRGEGSATFDYFTTVVTGESGAIRDDYEAVDDPAEISAKIADDPNALGFTGVGNYLDDQDNLDQLATVSIDGVEPSLENAQDGSYGPLARPLFIYVSTEALEGGDISDFASDYVDRVADLLPSVYFYPLPGDAYDLVGERLDHRTTGSVYEGDPFSGGDVVELLQDAR